MSVGRFLGFWHSWYYYRTVQTGRPPHNSDGTMTSEGQMTVEMLDEWGADYGRAVLLGHSNAGG